jgi:hypothetical protein
MTDTTIISHDESLPEGCKLTPTGLKLPPNLSFEDWEGIGLHLQTLESQFERSLQIVRWAIGDWLRYGEHRWGEKYAQAVKQTGLSEQRLMTLNWLAEKVEISRRRKELTIEHHVAIAALPPEDQERLLDEAVQEEWSARTLHRHAQDRDAENNGKDPAIARAGRALGAACSILKEIEDKVIQAGLIQKYLITPLDLKF